MTDTITAPGAPHADPGFFSRVVGIVTSPRETFESVLARPRWLGVLLLTTMVVVIAATLPTTTAAGQQATIDQNASFLESFRGRAVTDAEYDQLRQQAARAPYFTAGLVLIFSPIWAVIIAALLWTAFNAAMGGNATFKQVFTVVVHAGVVSTLGAIFTGLINYTRGTIASSTANLRVLLPMIEESTFTGRLLGAIDLFLIWWVFVLAIGLAVLYKRRTQPIAITLLAVYAVIALGIAVVGSQFGGGA